jgi:hypothetical protein
MIPHLDHHFHHYCTPPHPSFLVQLSLRLFFVTFVFVWQLSGGVQPLCLPLFVVSLSQFLNLLESCSLHTLLLKLKLLLDFGILLLLLSSGLFYFFFYCLSLFDDLSYVSPAPWFTRYTVNCIFM